MDRFFNSNGFLVVCYALTIVGIVIWWSAS